MYLISKGVMLWLVLSSFIVIFDGCYILLRPHTLKGGKYEWLYGPYQLYVQHDALYGGEVDDPFVVIIAWLNLAEVALTFLALFLSFCGKHSTQIKGAILAIVVSAFVFWKTVIYMWYDRQYMSEAARSFAPEAIALYYIPNAFWIMCPLWSIFSIGQKLGKKVFFNLTSKKV